MSDFKTKWKVFWRIVRECFMRSLTPGIMYFVAGCVNLLISAKVSTMSATIAWAVVCGVVALAYDGFLMWVHGGSHYEMLVSGNLKRRSAMQTGSELNISTYKFEKEYRPWKGFVMGFFNVVPLIIGAIVFHCNRNVIGHEGMMSGGLSAVVIVFDLFAGWALLPFHIANTKGIAANYLLALPFAILPVLVSGGMYIAGAYGRRNKTIRQQEIAARAAEAEANKPQKINYGGLPGTKPKKKK